MQPVLLPFHSPHIDQTVIQSSKTKVKKQPIEKQSNLCAKVCVVALTVMTTATFFFALSCDLDENKKWVFFNPRLALNRLMSIHDLIKIK